jgi:hypoxanthine phosphoribosyltransferase
MYRRILQIKLHVQEGIKAMAEALRLSDPDDLYISSEDIQNRVHELGADFSKRYEDSEELVVLTVLMGAIPFATDLRATIDHPNITQDSIRAKSYSGTTSTGNLRILKEPTNDLTGKDVLIVEDMLDSGLTLARLVPVIQDMEPASLEVVSFLEKPAQRQPNTEINAPVTVGIRIANEYVVGYGLDCDEEFRELPFITTGAVDTDGVYHPAITAEQPDTSLLV